MFFHDRFGYLDAGCVHVLSLCDGSLELRHSALPERSATFPKTGEKHNKSVFGIDLDDVSPIGIMSPIGYTKFLRCLTSQPSIAASVGGA